MKLFLNFDLTFVIKLFTIISTMVQCILQSCRRIQLSESNDNTPLFLTVFMSVFFRIVHSVFNRNDDMVHFLRRLPNEGHMGHVLKVLHNLKSKFDNV